MEGTLRTIVAPPSVRVLEAVAAPTFAIVIPAYEAASTIVECVESALTQTLPAQQVIVIDDGSSDGTGETLSPYRDRITYVWQENRGGAAAQNEGVRRATAEFVSLLDADDVYEPEHLEALAELAVARPDLDILMTDAYLEVGGEIVGRFSDHTPFASANQSVAIFEDCFIAWPAVRRTRLLALGGFDESLHVAKDWECWIRLLHAGCAAGLVDEPLMRYRIRAQSISSDRLAGLRARVHILELASQLDLSREERAALEHFLARRRGRVFLAEAERALRARGPDARRRSARAVLAPGLPATARLKALAAAVAPRTAARRLAAIEARTGHTRLERSVPRRTQS